jgi:hypothetical protein
MVATGLLGTRITHGAIAEFYFRHPARIWRHARNLLPIAFSLRPEWCGNFERIAGRVPGARSSAFTLWSGFHERVLRGIGRPILILLFISPAIAAIAWIRSPERRRQIELFALLCTGCLTAFLTAILGDAWDNVKHLFLFNLMLDACLILGAGFIIPLIAGRQSEDNPASDRALLTGD